MAIEDIMEIKDTVSERGIIPLDKQRAVVNSTNQIDFLRTMGEMGLSQQEIMMKLFQMFNENPSKFTQEFGLEAAETLREFLGLTTQGEMEKQGNVFRDNSAEIIGQNISMRPENFALGTLPTDQSDTIGELQPLEQWIVLNKEKAKELGLPVEQGQIYQRNTVTGVTKQMKTSVEDQFRVLSQEESFSLGLPEGQIWQMNETNGEVKNLYIDKEDKFSILSLEQSRSMGLPIDQGQIYQRNEITGNIQLLDTDTGQIWREGDTGQIWREGDDIKVNIKQKPDPDKKRAQEIEARFTYTTDDNGMVWMTDTVTGETQPAGTEEDRLPRLQTHDNIDMFRKIFRDLIRSGKETGSGIVNAIKEELKNMYKEYTEESPDYNPELIEKEKVEDYFPPKP